MSPGEESKCQQYPVDSRSDPVDFETIREGAPRVGFSFVPGSVSMRSVGLSLHTPDWLDLDRLSRLDLRGPARHPKLADCEEYDEVDEHELT